MPTYRNDSNKNINVHELLVLPPGATYETYTTYNITGLTEISASPTNSRDALFTISNATSADGAQTVSVHTAGVQKTFWEIQFEVSATPTTGTITVGIKAPGASEFTDLSTTVDLTSSNLLITFSAIAEEIRLTPSGFDSDKSYNAYIYVG